MRFIELISKMEENREFFLFSILWKQILQKGDFSFLQILRKKGKKTYLLQKGKKALKKGIHSPFFSQPFADQL